MMVLEVEKEPPWETGSMMPLKPVSKNYSAECPDLLTKNK